jgi:hypothetical protein
METYVDATSGSRPSLLTGRSVPGTTSAVSPASTGSDEEAMQAAAGSQAQQVASQASDAVDRTQRPGCVTAYALLLLAAGGLVTLGSLVFGASGEVPVLGVLLALGVGALYISLGVGLSRLKNWARVVILIIQGLGLAFGLIGLLVTLPNGDGMSILSSLTGLITGSIIVYWFANHGALFD